MSWAGHQDQRWGGWSFSQHGEDLMILNLLELVCAQVPYTYLDIGAHHSRNISNTALLYDRGACGVLVEPNPNLVHQLKIDRPRDIVLQCGVAARRGKLTLYMHDQWSGLNTMSPSEKELLKQSGYPIREELEVDVVSINSIVAKHFTHAWPDFVSIDVEGLDYEILESAEFANAGPKVICVEVRKPDTLKFKDLMYMKNYSGVCRMGENMIFVERRYLHLIG